MKLKGRLRIGVTNSNSRGDYATVEVTDDAAGVRFLVAEFSLEALAKMLVGRSEVEVDVELRGLDKVGTIREHKRELVPYDCYQSPRTEEHIAAVLAPFEVDGWQARRGDLQNGHNLVAVEAVRHQRVTFERWVKREEQP